MRPNGSAEQGIASAAGTGDAERSVVATRSGLLRGMRMSGVGVWRGIPYAAAPVGALRFRAPQPPTIWAGIREATCFGASAPQPVSIAERVLGVDGHEPSSEDCLTLNIWSRGPGGRARPVLVWLHGGSFMTGAGSDTLYDGQRFATRGDVVVVSLNYRLGPLGFLHLEEGPGADVNLGLRDQIAALGWVRDNIAAFGGDPGTVTLFGQSAGAMAIGALLAAPAARPLFHRAILQSGAARHLHDRATAAVSRRRVLRALGLRRADLDRLRELPVEALVGAGDALAGQASLVGLPFQPMVDDAVVVADPLVALRAGSMPAVPLLIGTTRDELALYNVAVEQDPRPRFRKRMRRLRAIAGLAAEIGPRRLVRLRAAYPGGAAGALDLAADAVFGQPAVALAEAQGGAAPVFMYRFDWRSLAYAGRLGACHALDVPFVWNNLDRSAARLLSCDDPAACALAETMQDAWIAFARTGQPCSDGLPDWPAYVSSERATMIFDAPCRVVRDPYRERRTAWARVR